MAKEKEEFIELDHFVRAGTMVIGETEYKITNGKVKVSQEHVLNAVNHIKTAQP